MTTGDGRSPGPSWTALKESSRRTASHVDRSPSSQMQDELEESVPPPPRKRRPRRSGSGDEANGGKSKKRPKVYDGLQGTSSGQVRTKEPPFVNFGGSGEPAGSSSSAFPVVRKKKKRKILNEDELAELARQPAPSLSADLGPSSSRPVKTFTASQPVISRPLKVSAKRKARATDSSSDEAVVIPRKNSSSDVATRIVSATQPAGRTERRDSVNVREDEPTRGSVATSISKLVPPRLKPLPGEATKPCPSFKTPPATQPVTSRKDTSSSVLPQTQPTPLRSVQKPGHVSSSSARGRSMSPSRSSSPEFPESISAMVAADLARPKQVARKVPSSAFRHKRGSQKEKWQKGLESAIYLHYLSISNLLSLQRV
ncbi:hypothetical protein OBBRIDRAFT_60836 [Obba rivulosa]|uniref:Uncharacterized protein n=1 Tax=Obba rivulosa TaxID=1052685 RepID=A0A8E2AQQ3_9APHY|nr:hypothetical protein OBBRIDRAFT_60836 [Obba rivulosa]